MNLYSSSFFPVAGFNILLPVSTLLAIARITGFSLLRGFTKSANNAGGNTTANISQSLPASKISLILLTV